MNAESVKARLKKVAVETGRTFQDLLGSYGIERTIFSVTTDDPLTFDMDSLAVKAITEFKEYHGVNVSITAYLDRTRIPVSIDIGFGDVVYPDRILMDFPVLLPEDAPKVYAYSLYSSIAEKFEAMVSLGYDNSRFKDFYDIYVNALKYDFKGQILKDAIKETFTHRGTALHTIVVFNEEYTNDTMRLSRWKSFAKKKKISIDVGFPETMEVIKQFLIPVVGSIETGKSFDAMWDSKKLQWV